MNLKHRLTKISILLSLLSLVSLIGGQSIVYSYGTVATTTEERGHSQSTRTNVRRSSTARVLVQPAATPLVRAQAEALPLFYQDLYYGATDGDVVRLQNFLRTNGYFTYPASTGNFGLLTFGSLVAFQRVHDLRSTGVVDEPTRAQINHELQTPSAMSVSVGKKNQDRQYVLGSVSLVLQEIQQTQQEAVAGSVDERELRTTTQKFLDLISQLFTLLR